MGNQQSVQPQWLPVSPLIKKLRSTLLLKPQKALTHSFISHDFCLSLLKSPCQISRLGNPFCPIQINHINSQQWITCCLISPIMALVLPNFVMEDGTNKLKISGLGKMGSIVLVQVNALIIVEKLHVGIVILKKPLVELGWTGITYLQNIQQITQEPFRTINHLKRHKITNKDGRQLFTYSQTINKRFYKPESKFIATCKEDIGALVFRVIQNKPYVIGIQINNEECRFFDKKIFQKIIQAAKDYLNTSKQRQILMEIDLQAFQLMEKL